MLRVPLSQVRLIVSILLMPVLLLALFLLLRGYQSPGGCFVSGLLTSAALVGYAFVAPPAIARRIQAFNYITLAAVGLLISVLWGSLSLLAGQPFLAFGWVGETMADAGQVGTALLFIIGIYLLVVGATTCISLLLIDRMLPPGSRIRANGQEQAPVFSINARQTRR